MEQRVVVKTYVKPVNTITYCVMITALNFSSKHHVGVQVWCRWRDLHSITESYHQQGSTSNICPIFITKRHIIQGFPSVLYYRSPWDSYVWFMRVLRPISRVPYCMCLKLSMVLFFVASNKILFNVELFRHHVQWGFSLTHTEHAMLKINPKVGSLSRMSPAYRCNANAGTRTFP